MSKHKTILFAEDDPVVLAAYRKPLEAAGYHVMAALDGLVTLEKLFMYVPDLLILDLMLPKFDGEKLLQFIWSPPQLTKVPVIVLTSKCAVEPEYERLIKSAAKYLIKQDCTPAILLQTVREQFSGQFQARRAGTETASDHSIPSLIRGAQKIYSAT